MIPIVFLFLYSYLYENNYFSDLVIMGKEFYSGREGYFIEVLNDLKNYLFLVILEIIILQILIMVH